MRGLHHDFLCPTRLLRRQCRRAPPTLPGLVLELLRSLRYLLHNGKSACYHQGRSGPLGRLFILLPALHTSGGRYRMGIWGFLFGRRQPRRAIIEGDGDFAFDVVGESRYQMELELIVGRRTKDGAEYYCAALLTRIMHHAVLFLRAALAGTHRRSVLWEPFGANS
jgi:hypothetical protein